MCDHNGRAMEAADPSQKASDESAAPKPLRTGAFVEAALLLGAAFSFAGKSSHS
jgi:hypothetical protein